MRLRFRVLNTSLKGLEFETDNDTVRIGRAASNDLVLREQSVSRRHATIEASDGELTVRDEGSRNNTKVDGEEIDVETPISENSVLAFGDVIVQVSLPDQRVVDEEESEITPEAAALAEVENEALESPAEEKFAEAAEQSALTTPEGKGIEKAEKSPPAIGSAEEAIERKFWPVLTLLCGIAIAGLLILYFLNSSGELDKAKGTMAIALRVGKSKVVKVPTGFVDKWTVQPPERVKVERPWKNLNYLLQLTGGSRGITIIKLYNKQGDHVVIYANVLPRKREEVGEGSTEVSRSKTERLVEARNCIRRAELFREQDDIYIAKKEYEKAIKILESLERDAPSELSLAIEWQDELEAQIERRYDQLTFDVSNLLKVGERRRALEKLAQIKALIPDESDVRWQNADLLYRMVERILRKKEEQTRRGL
ncbi:MAG: FHA domain-containing protein [Candidatus Brocadiia bacterium]